MKPVGDLPVFNQDREQAFAKTALGLMGGAGVVATPDNFELFYAYASGENPAISQVMGAIINAKQPFTPELLADLRLRCLSGARAAVAMESLGGNMSALINDMLGKLESSARDAADYKDTLSAATGELGSERNPADVRKLVEGLIAATRAMEERTKSLEGELQASSQQVSELRDKLDDVRKESMTDPLTHIANRKAFDDAVEAARKASAEGEEVCLLMCDIDHFKKFNDSWGHQTGDQVLRLVASCLAENVKGRDTAARYGGEEFAVLLRGTPLEAATMVANQIRTTVETKKLVKKSTGDVLGTITISIGVAKFTPGEATETVIRRADACLYGAKHSGRNLVINQDDPRMAALETSAA
ncbi:MAG: GGDEF domain-containing protein [Alphaproteobacteria bacterium]|nr:GGDEF domain-containing protein [Alphaproteobacteria bacterium]